MNQAAKAELAPNGTLRVGINHSNHLLVNPGSVHGAPRGVAPDLGAELARRLGASVEYVSFSSVGATFDGGKAGLWDVAFLGAEPQRAAEMEFTAAYLEIPITFLVPAGSPIRTIADVDRDGVRVAVADRSAYDLFLTRELKRAKIMRADGIPGSVELFRKQSLEVLAGLRPALMADAAKFPGSRILEGQITAVQQAIATSKSRPAGASYLKRFVEEAKASGLVQQLIDRHGVKGVNVAPAARI
jgi:polar amino acid transport system substrate-binding protein